jgi:uncharacterized protein (TIGR03437 family)
MLVKCVALCVAAISAALSAANAQAPSFTADGLVNAATGQTVVAPYSICTIYGTDLFLNGAAAATGAVNVPNTLAGVTVLIGVIPAGIFYVSANQINLLIPNSLTPGTYSMRVVRDGVSSHAVPFVIQEVAPGLFASQASFVAAQHLDGTSVTGNSPAAPGELVVLYGTGLGRTQPDASDRSVMVSAAPIVHAGDFQVLLDGVAIDPSRVQYAGIAPFNAGLYQVNVQLPVDLANTNPQLQVSVGGSLSPAGLRLITGPLPATN